MSIVAGSNNRVYVGGFDLSLFLRNAKIAQQRDTADSTTYKTALQPTGATWREFIALLKGGNAALEGNYEGDLGEVDERFEAAFSSPAPVTTIALRDVLSGVAYAFLANGSAYEISAPVEGLVSISAAFQASQGVERLLVNHPLGAEVTAGNGGAIDNGAASNNGAVAYLHVVDFDGTDCTVKIADSANGSTYADLASFAVVTGANASERKAIAGTIRQFTRWAISGTFNSITFQLAIGRK